jgi:hypothetical protein
MSFSTTLHFDRPTKPPLIRGATLARFLEKFLGLGGGSG